MSQDVHDGGLERVVGGDWVVDDGDPVLAVIRHLHVKGRVHGLELCLEMRAQDDVVDGVQKRHGRYPTLVEVPHLETYTCKRKIMEMRKISRLFFMQEGV
jgi:hypothetical protein